MEWPYRRFVKAFDSFQRRTMCDEWTQRKITHLAALVANTNLDDERNDRASIVAKVEEAYDTILAKIWNGGQKTQTEKAEDEAWDSSFMKRGRSQIAMVEEAGTRVQQPEPPELPGEQTIGALPA